MGSLKFELTIFGGKADASRVEAVRLARLVDGIAQDLLDVCRNLSGDNDDSTPWPEKAESCRLYVVGLPQKGKSVSWPCETEESPLAWGEESGRAYIGGLVKLRHVATRKRDASLPIGFDREILSRIDGYYDQLSDYSGMALHVQANGRPELRAVFDAELRTIVRIKLALIENEIALPVRREPDHRLYGHSVQGILYELSDPDYDDPDAVIRFEVDPHDGTRWVCRMKRSDAPADFQELWRSLVVVEGTATMRPKKPELEVDTIISLRQADPLKAFDRLMQLSGGLMDGQTLEQVMDEIRERR